MSDAVTIKVDLKGAQDAIEALFARVGNRPRVHRAIGLALSERVRLGFKNSTGPYGPWKPLSPITIRRRRNKSNQPLLDTGRLRNSITYEADDVSVRVGTNVDYAPFHQFGTRGRLSAGGRVQPVNRRGRFISKDKAGRNKRVTGIRFLNFAAGSGAIPRRAFLPDQGLPQIWEQEDVIGTIEDYLEVSA